MCARTSTICRFDELTKIVATYEKTATMFFKDITDMLANAYSRDEINTVELQSLFEQAKSYLKVGI